MEQGEIILYQPDETIKLEVRMEDETVWLTQAQIAELFGTGRQAITKHLKNIFSSEELKEDSVCSILELTASDGKNYKTKVYNLDAILSVGYRVNSKKRNSFQKMGEYHFKRTSTEGIFHKQTSFRVGENCCPTFREDRLLCPHFTAAGGRYLL
jgi:hypothetical protein